MKKKVTKREHQHTTQKNTHKITLIQVIKNIYYKKGKF